MFPVLRCDPCRQKLNFLFDVLLLTLLEERRVLVVYRQTFLQCCVLLSTLYHHEEPRVFAAVVEGWRKVAERGGITRETASTIATNITIIVSIILSLPPFLSDPRVEAQKKRTSSHKPTHMGLQWALHHKKEPSHSAASYLTEQCFLVRTRPELSGRFGGRPVSTLTL